jgi:hypothetical protein
MQKTGHSIPLREVDMLSYQLECDVRKVIDADSHL